MTNNTSHLFLFYSPDRYGYVATSLVFGFPLSLLSDPITCFIIMILSMLLFLFLGGLVFNDTIVHLSNHSLPFGGVGMSGMGHYHGKYTFETFTHEKAVMNKPYFGDMPARYPPYTPGK